MIVASSSIGGRESKVSLQNLNFIFDNQLLIFFLKGHHYRKKNENCIQYPCNFNNNGQ
jgi:hypothetical protein